MRFFPEHCVIDRCGLSCASIDPASKPSVLTDADYAERITDSCHFGLAAHGMSKAATELLLRLVTHVFPPDAAAHVAAFRQAFAKTLDDDEIDADYVDEALAYREGLLGGLHGNFAWDGVQRI